MASATHLSLAVGFALPLLVGCLYKSPELAKNLHIGIYNAGIFGTGPGDAIQEKQKRLLTVLRAKQDLRCRVAQDVLHRKCSLLEAAACFRQLQSQSVLILKLPLREENDDPAFLCERVIRWARAEAAFAHDPQFDDVICALEAELHEVQESEVTLVLPVVPASQLAVLSSGAPVNN